MKKIIKHHSGFISSQNEIGKAENEKKKISFQVRSYPTQFRKFQKNSIKTQKMKKHHSGFISSQNGTGIAENEKKKKLFLVRSYPTQFRKFQKNSIKIQKIKKHHSSQNRMGKAENE